MIDRDLIIGTPNPFDGIPVIESPFVPKGMVFMVNGQQLVCASMRWEHRRRFWYKPWTWLRKNGWVDWTRVP